MNTNQVDMKTIRYIAMWLTDPIQPFEWEWSAIYYLLNLFENYCLQNSNTIQTLNMSIRNPPICRIISNTIKIMTFLDCTHDLHSYSKLRKKLTKWGYLFFQAFHINSLKNSTCAFSSRRIWIHVSMKKVWKSM